MPEGILTNLQLYRRRDTRGLTKEEGIGLATIMPVVKRGIEPMSAE